MTDCTTFEDASPDLPTLMHENHLNQHEEDCPKQMQYKVHLLEAASRYERMALTSECIKKVTDKKVRNRICDGDGGTFKKGLTTYNSRCMHRTHPSTIL